MGISAESGEMRGIKMSNKTRTAKGKGRLGQNEIRDILLEDSYTLEPDDIRSTTMGDSGEDILLSPKARKAYPWNIEVKRRKKFAMSTYMKQAIGHGDYEPVLFFREDRGQWYACITIDHLLKLNRGKGSNYKVELDD